MVQVASVQPQLTDAQRKAMRDYRFQGQPAEPAADATGSQTEVDDFDCRAMVFQFQVGYL